MSLNVSNQGNLLPDYSSFAGSFPLRPKKVGSSWDARDPDFALRTFEFHIASNLSLRMYRDVSSLQKRDTIVCKPETTTKLKLSAHTSFKL